MKLSLFHLHLWNSNPCHFQTARKYFKNTEQIVVGMSDTLNSPNNHLLTDL